jgi:hypothetical protein
VAAAAPSQLSNIMSNQAGFILSVYRDASGDDCSMRGISSQHKDIFVIADGLLFAEKGPFTEEEATKLTIPIFEVGIAGGRYHVKPKGEKRWTMFGGNFAYSCDSRTPQYPIHIHDRIEN